MSSIDCSKFTCYCGKCQSSVPNMLKHPNKDGYMVVEEISYTKRKFLVKASNEEEGRRAHAAMRKLSDEQMLDVDTIKFEETTKGETRVYHPTYTDLSLFDSDPDRKKLSDTTWVEIEIKMEKEVAING